MCLLLRKDDLKMFPFRYLSNSLFVFLFTTVVKDKHKFNLILAGTKGTFLKGFGMY